MFKKEQFYKHKNGRDIIIQILWSGQYRDYYKLKIAFWNISPKSLPPFPINETKIVKVFLTDLDQWQNYKIT